jgi:uncharacterized protein with PIN domain
MVIDTSALIAILKGEPESVAFKRAIYADPIRLIVPFGVPNPRLEAKRRVDEVALCDDID